jgi:CRP-like cAMP-binding protein
MIMEELPAHVVQRRPVDGIGMLQTHPVFGVLAPAQIKRLGSFARARRIESATTLFVKGDPGTALFAVVSGTVKVTVPSIDGREATFNLSVQARFLARSRCSTASPAAPTRSRSPSAS